MKIGVILGVLFLLLVGASWLFLGEIPWWVWISVLLIPLPLILLGIYGGVHRKKPKDSGPKDDSKESTPTPPPAPSPAKAEAKKWNIPWRWVIGVPLAAVVIWLLWGFIASTDIGKIITGSGAGEPRWSSAARSGGEKGGWRHPTSSQPIQAPVVQTPPVCTPATNTRVETCTVTPDRGGRVTYDLSSPRGLDYCLRPTIDVLTLPESERTTYRDVHLVYEDGTTASLFDPSREEKGVVAFDIYPKKKMVVSYRLAETCD